MRIRENRLQKAVIAAVKSDGGHGIRDHHVAVERKGGTLEFRVRLSERMNPLPTYEWLDKRYPQDESEEGILEGAQYLLVGSASSRSPAGSDEKQAFCSAQIIDAETSVIKKSAQADLTGGRGVVKAALLEAFDDLRARFKRATDGRAR